MSRGAIDIALPNMFSNSAYETTYLFYAHMIGQCSIVIDRRIKSPAGVAFMYDHYRLYINPDIFDTYELEEQLAILKHEMLHILNDHVLRTEDRKQLPWNYATDCAINQLIDDSHLPKIKQKDIDKYNASVKLGLVDITKPAPKIGDFACVMPSTFPVSVDVDLSAEQYYDALKNEEQENEDESCSKCGGSGQMKDEEDSNGEQTDENSSQGTCTCDRCQGTGKEPGGGDYGEGISQILDDHGMWSESKGDREMQKATTKGMIEKSIEETVKSNGTIPSNIEHWLNLFKTKSQISWKKALRNIVGKRKVNTRRTIMKRDRRFPDREDLKGKTKDIKFYLTVILDVSGSMSDKEIMIGLNEIHHICKLTNTTMQLIQVDTKVHNVETFSAKTKLFNRSGAGGTIMEPAIDYIKKNKIPTDACILITDGYIEDVSRWKNKPKYPIMFLVTSEGQNIPGIRSNKKYKQYQLKVK